MVGNGVGVKLRGPCPIYVKKKTGGSNGGRSKTGTEAWPRLPNGGVGTPDMAATTVCPAVGMGPVGSMRVACKRDPIHGGRSDDYLTIAHRRCPWIFLPRLCLEYGENI